MRRLPLALVLTLVLAGCGSADSATSGPTIEPVAQTPQATGEEAASFAAFRAHLATSGGVVHDLVLTFATDAGAGKLALVKEDATKIKAWAATEAAWLDANGSGFCYANLYMLWDIAREHAEQAAVDALAGKYEASAAELDKMTAATTSLAERMDATAC